MSLHQVKTLVTTEQWWALFRICLLTWKVILYSCLSQTARGTFKTMSSPLLTEFELTRKSLISNDLFSGVALWSGSRKLKFTLVIIQIQCFLCAVLTSISFNLTVLSVVWGVRQPPDYWKSASMPVWGGIAGMILITCSKRWSQTVQNSNFYYFLLCVVQFRRFSVRLFCTTNAYLVYELHSESSVCYRPPEYLQRTLNTYFTIL